MRSEEIPTQRRSSPVVYRTMDQRQVLAIVVLCFAISFQAGAAMRAEENVCCDSKWNSTDIRGGCCGQGWDVHCCYSSIIPQTRQEKTLFVRTETCCVGEKRIPVDKLHNQLYKGIVWLQAIVLATTVVLTAIMVFACCRSFFGLYSESRNYPMKRIIQMQPSRYGAMLGTETWSSGRGYRYATTDGFGFAAYPGLAQPAHHVPFTKIDYPLAPWGHYQPRTEMQAPASTKKV